MWAWGSVGVLGLFAGFVLLGWPGAPDSCTTTTPQTCFCEAFRPEVVNGSAGGVRQPGNTFSNLYAVITSLIAAGVVARDRRAGTDGRAFTGIPWLADVYVFAMLFLGLGSMWFHASLKEWAGNVDGLSMYLFVAFLVCYTGRRLCGSDRVFWTLYITTALSVSLAHSLWNWEHAPLVLILTLVAVYLGLEVWVWVQTGKVMLGAPKTIALWSSAGALVLVATVVWLLSQTGGPLCYPTKVLQPHGFVWHTLTGVASLLLFFYWRGEPVGAVAETRVADET